MVYGVEEELDSTLHFPTHKLNQRGPPGASAPAAMATYIRRGLTRLVESQKAPKPAALTFARPEGTVTLNAREAARYGMLMTMLDSDGDNEIGGMEGASFLRRSGLDVGEARAVRAAARRSCARARERERERVR